MGSVGWSKDTGDKEAGEVEFHFSHPHPLDATLWFYEDEWILDLAWMNGGFVAGKKVEQARHRTENITEAKAKMWGSDHIRKVLAT